LLAVRCSYVWQGLQFAWCCWGQWADTLNSVWLSFVMLSVVCVSMRGFIQKIVPDNGPATPTMHERRHACHPHRQPPTMCCLKLVRPAVAASMCAVDAAAVDLLTRRDQQATDAACFPRDNTPCSTGPSAETGKNERTTDARQCKTKFRY
jgi:hypothetical protein